jgi:glycosyltransferase involved in cell wall biosynthesis
MNILIIPTNDWSRAAGAGHINEIAEQLAQRGHRVYAWNFDLYKQQSIKRPIRKVKLISSRTLPLSDPAIYFTLNALFQAPTIFKVIRNKKVDVVINENILYGLIAFLAADSRVLKVFDFSDYFPESASVYYSGSFNIIKNLVEFVALTITRLNIKFSDICLAVCQSLIATTANIDKTKRCYLITNGVNTVEIAESAETSAKDERPSMVVMGVIDAWLDLQLPLKALAMLKNKYPELKLIIIGPWQRQEFRKKFEDHVKSMQLDSSVEITGYVSKERLVQYLRRATCFVMPYNLNMFYSVIRLPEKLFVYSAYGKAILSTRLPEIVNLQKEHIFFYNNVEEFERKLDDILSKKDVQIGIEEKALAFAAEHDTRVLAQQLESILMDNLAKSRKS